MRDYELMVVLDSNLDDESTEAATARITGAVTQRQGTIQHTDVWGKRRLAYPIGRHRDGNYILIRFQAAAEVANEVERQLKLMEAVIRHLIVRTDEPLPVAAVAAA